MIYISKDRQIHVVWSIFRGTSDVHEDFSRALVKVFLIGNYEKYLLEAVAEGGNLVFDIPQGLPEGAYSLEAIWVKNYNNLLPCSDTLTPSVDSGCRNQPLRWPFKHPHDHRFNDRCIMRSRKDFVFALTEYDSESTFYKDSGEAEIKIRSAVATYGYDGLSAYEIAVLRGDFNGTEGEYLDSLKFKLEVAQEHKLGGITAVTKTDDETEEVKVDPETGRLYVKPGEGSLSVATETKLGGIKAATKTSLETQEVKIDPVTGKLYTLPGGEGGVEIVNNPDEEDLHSVEQSADVHVLQFADKEHNASSFSGLGRVYLRKNISDGKNVLTQAMMSKSNTRYIIQYDYDLDGKMINIPVWCILDFQGGSLTNGTLFGTNTEFLGSPRINCDFEGKFAGIADFSWFGLKPDDKEFDNALIINKYGSFFSNIYIPTGKYYTKTPIVIDGRKNITVDGNISYLGDINSTCITIKNAYSNDININGFISNSENENLSHENFGEDANIIGIDFQNCNNCKIYVSSVIDFSENMRVSGIGEGCSYNIFRFDLLNDGNVGLRIYQEDKDGEYGWANENMFIGGRIAISQSWNNSEIDACAIKISGAGTGKDSYNKVNALYFLKISTEWFKHTGYTIYAKNLLSSTFLEGRNENSSTYIKWVGQCNRNEVDLGYLRNPTFNYDEATGYPFRWDGTKAKQFMLFEFNWDDLVPYYYDDAELTNSICARDFRFGFVRNLSSLTDLSWQLTCGDSYESGFNFTLPAIRIDASSVKVFYIVADTATRFHVSYIYNSDGELLTQQDQASYPAPISFLSRYSLSTRGFKNDIDEQGTLFMIPDNISQIEFSIEGKFDYVRVYSRNSYASVLTPTKSKTCSIENIPTSGALGEQRTVTENDIVLTRAKHYWMNPDGTNKSKVTII